MSTDPASLPWRTGRHFPRHMYAQIGEEPSGTDPYVGTLETAELAALACVAHNDLLIRGELEARARRQALAPPPLQVRISPGYGCSHVPGCQCRR